MTTEYMYKVYKLRYGLMFLVICPGDIAKEYYKPQEMDFRMDAHTQRF
jgi:hypothetical protein